MTCWNTHTHTHTHTQTVIPIPHGILPACALLRYQRVALHATFATGPAEYGPGNELMAALRFFTFNLPARSSQGSWE